MFSNILGGAAGFPTADLGDTVSQSLRFRGAQVLSRTFSGDTNRDKCTFSAWIKRSDLSSSNVIFGAATSNNTFERIIYNPTSTLSAYAQNGGTDYINVRSSALFRDPSAWYHLVYIKDTTQSTSTDRIKFFINGARVTDLEATTFPGQNTTTGQINNDVLHTIGRDPDTAANFFEGYLAHVYFLDDIVIGETNGVVDEFGRYNEDGVWVPDNYTGTYGTNGFHLDFADSSDLGNDVSGNNNDFTATGFDTADIALYTGNEAGSTSTYQSNSANRTQALINEGSTFDGATAGGTQVNGGSGGYWYLENQSFTGLTGLRILWPDVSQAADVRLNGTSVSFTTSGSYTVVDTDDIPATVTEIAARRDRDNTQILQVEINTGSGFTALLDNTDNDVDYNDTPTSNYATYNPIVNNDEPTFAGANLDATAINNGLVWSTQELPNEHLYAEFIRDGASDRFAAGVARVGDDGFEVGAANDNDYAFMIVYSEFAGNNRIYNESTTHSQTGLTAYNTGDVLGVEWRGDLATRQVNFYINGTQVGSSENVAAGGNYHFAVNRAGGSNPPEVLANFGQMPFLAAPTGVSNTTHGMQTNNLAEPTIKNGKEHFETIIWDGNDTDDRDITTTEGFAPDLVWIKRRNSDNDHGLWDTIRGANNSLSTNLVGVQVNRSDGLKQFNSDGFRLGTWSVVNADSPNTYVAWCWKAGDTFTPSQTGGLTNLSGTRNTTAGFSIIRYRGAGANATVGHGLNSAPEFIIFKDYTDTNEENWNIYHSALDASNGERLAFNTASIDQYGSTLYNSTAPTSSVIHLGNNVDINDNGEDVIAYCWHSVEGFSKFGSYDGNGSSDGPFVYLGFKPALVCWKRIDSSGGWFVVDSARDPTNLCTNKLRWDTDGTVSTAGAENVIDMLSNGFKVRANNATQNNGSGEYIYMAWGEHPFGGENAAPATAR